jgi:hypothetical protein
MHVGLPDDPQVRLFHPDAVAMRMAVIVVNRAEGLVRPIMVSKTKRIAANGCWPRQTIRPFLRPRVPVF